MDEKKFREVETRYKILSDQHRKGEINSDTLKKELKKMMVLDEENRYWMIGGKTGKWYTYDGKEWKEDNPYEKIVEKKDAFESFETELLSPGMDSSTRAAGIFSTREDSSTIRAEVKVEEHDDLSTIKVDTPSRSRKDEDAEFERFLSRQDKEISNFEVISTQEDEIISMDAQEESAPSRSADYEVVLPSDEESAANLEIESSQPDSSTTRLDEIPGTPKQDETYGLDLMEKAREDSKTIKRKASLWEDEKKQAEEVPAAKITKKGEKTEELVISSIDMISLIFFLGGIGLIVGVLFGAVFGIFKGAFGDLIYYFPEMLQGVQGGLIGGLIFAALGGIAGFISFAISAVAISAIYNLIAFVFGGIRVKIK